jgi:hypothetical protein
MLNLHMTEERFSHCVIPAISAKTKALAKSVFFAPTVEHKATFLGFSLPRRAPVNAQ